MGEQGEWGFIKRDDPLIGKQGSSGVSIYKSGQDETIEHRGWGLLRVMTIFL